MYCSPHLQPATLIPTRVRDRLGAVLGGPPPGRHDERYPVCLFALGRIGDFVLMLSALRALVREFGPAACVLVIPTPLAGLVAREFPGVRCVALPTEAASLFRHILPIWRTERPKLAEFHFGQLICLSHQRSLYYELALSWIQTEKTARLVPATYPPTPTEGLCTELLGHWRLVEQVLGRPIPREEILPRFSTQDITDGNQLVVYPLSLDATRSITPEKTAQVLLLWRSQNRAPVIFGGSPGDEPALRQYADLARAAGVQDVSIETPAGLQSLLDHVAHAGAVFAGDSAAAHLAAAFDKPSVVLTNRRFYGYAQPWSRSTRQQVFLHEESPERIAGALPKLEHFIPPAP
jgi:ADP-heptose:LPS heptosyltransferase